MQKERRGHRRFLAGRTSRPSSSSRRSSHLAGPIIRVRMATASSSNLRLQQISTDDSQSEFVAFRASMRLPIAPVWAADGSAGGASGTGGMEGVKEVLASWVMR